MKKKIKLSKLNSQLQENVLKETAAQHVLRNTNVDEHVSKTELEMVF